MRILIVRHADSGKSGETNITGIYPPLGLAYIAAALRNAGYQVIFWDNQILRLNESSLAGEIKKVRPDIALFSAMTPAWPEIIRLSSVIKGISSQIITGVGGPHLSVYPGESVSIPSIDFGVYGEGEQTILEILKNIQNGQGLEGVKGCIFRKDNKVIVNAPRQPIDDLDALPFPAIDLLPYKKYFALSVKRPLFSIVTSRGCPYTCKFCFQGHLGKYRTRSPENVAAEMEILVNKYNIRHIIVFDETFAAEKERALEVCGLIRKKKIKFEWDLRTRVDLLDRDILAALKSAGCLRIHLGIESGNQGILNKMDKRLKIADIAEKINMAKNYGFQLRGYFMLGFPGDTRSSILETIAFAKALSLDWASFTIAMGLPGTDIYKHGLSEGYFYNDYWREYAKGNVLNVKPYFIPAGLKKQDLFVFKKKAYLQFYLRPGIIWNMIRNSRLIDCVGSFRVFFRLLPLMFRSIAEI